MFALPLLTSFQRAFGIWFEALGSVKELTVPSKALLHRSFRRQLKGVVLGTLPTSVLIASSAGLAAYFQLRLASGVIVSARWEQGVISALVLEIAPLTTAILIAGRSGTSLATELGTMKANQEWAAMRSCGIDPEAFVLYPRMLSIVLGVCASTWLFAAISIWSLQLFRQLGSDFVSPLAKYLIDSFDAVDIPFLMMKSLVLGLVIALCCSYHGLQVRVSSAEIPERASRAVTHSLAFVVLFSLMMSLAFYWLKAHLV